MSTRNEPVDLTPAPWMKWVLAAAAVYNLAWGAFAIVAPQTMLALHQLDPPLNYPAIWQCLGMVIGLYGLGYAIAATDPYRHWPLVLVGLLGKLFGPLGFIPAALSGELPWSFGLPLITNDLIWWIPFAMILYGAVRANQPGMSDQSQPPLDIALAEARSQQGVTLAELSHQAPTLVVFVRHAGCTFCRETLDELSLQRAEIEQRGVQIAVVHLGQEDEGTAAYFAHYGLGDVPRFADPERRLFRAFELPLGNLGQLLGPNVMWRGFVTAIIKGYWFGPLAGNGLQLSGSFLVHEGQILAAQRHEDAAEQNDFDRLSCAWRPETAVVSEAR